MMRHTPTAMRSAAAVPIAEPHTRGVPNPPTDPLVCLQAGHTRTTPKTDDHRNRHRCRLREQQRHLSPGDRAR
jgi:hypothetical protein